MTSKRFYKLTTKLACALLVAVAAAVSCFALLWGLRLDVYHGLKHLGLLGYDEDAFMAAFSEKAKDISLEKLEVGDDTDADLLELADLRDDYMGFGILVANPNEEERWDYLAGFYPRILDDFITGSFFNGYEAYYISDEEEVEQWVQFQDGEALVVVTSYHIAQMIIPYLIACIAVSALVFLIPILWLIRRRIRYLNRVKEDILIMAEGDLQHPVTISGHDEISILAQQLDLLRTTLEENIEQEKESRKANRDLISALSHDLRTPLTTLHGYLEIIKMQKGDPNLREEFLDRCIRKTEEIKELSDKMFEYALVFERDEELVLERIPLSEVTKLLTENCDFLELNGFSVRRQFTQITGFMEADSIMLKRIFNNLFSNILKYGASAEEVEVQCAVHQNVLEISLLNHMRAEQEKVESNRIGLKSVQKMMQLHHGDLFVLEQESVFSVRLRFPLSAHREEVL